MEISFGVWAVFGQCSAIGAHVRATGGILVVSQWPVLVGLKGLDPVAVNLVALGRSGPNPLFWKSQTRVGFTKDRLMLARGLPPLFLIAYLRTLMFSGTPSPLVSGGLGGICRL